MKALLPEYPTRGRWARDFEWWVVLTRNTINPLVTLPLTTLPLTNHHSPLRHYAPYFPSRPACAIARDIKYFAGNWPRPPRRQFDSPNSTTPSGRHERAHRRMGTWCQLWLLSLLGVLWSPVTMSTSGLRPRTRGISVSSRSIISTLAGKFPSSPVLSVYL